MFQMLHISSLAVIQNVFPVFCSEVDGCLKLWTHCPLTPIQTPRLRASADPKNLFVSLRGAILHEGA